jgi:hypothetical protein
VVLFLLWFFGAIKTSAEGLKEKKTLKNKRRTFKVVKLKTKKKSEKHTHKKRNIKSLTLTELLWVLMFQRRRRRKKKIKCMRTR